jgi:tetratricopeptide (TPR) repeat protein
MASNRTASWNRVQEAEKSGFVALVIELVEGHLKDHPDDTEGWLVYGESLSRVRLFDSAYDAFQNALDYSSNEAAPWIFLRCGQVLDSIGESPRAMHWLEEATELLPDESDIWLQLGICQRKIGNLTEAAESFQRAIQCPNGNIDEAYFQLAGIYLAWREYLKAQQLYKQAVEINPHYDAAIQRIVDIEQVIKHRRRQLHGRLNFSEIHRN